MPERRCKLMIFNPVTVQEEPLKSVIEKWQFMVWIV